MVAKGLVTVTLALKVITILIGQDFVIFAPIGQDLVIRVPIGQNPVKDVGPFSFGNPKARKDE